MDRFDPLVLEAPFRTLGTVWTPSETAKDPTSATNLSLFVNNVQKVSTVRK